MKEKKYHPPRNQFRRSVRALLVQQEEKNKLPQWVVDRAGEPDPDHLPYINHLSRIQSMINVGCKFGPDDLEPQVWDGLIAIAMEKKWIQDRIDAKTKGPLPQDSQQKVVEARAKDKIPQPGGTIFPQSRPLK